MIEMEQWKKCEQVIGFAPQHVGDNQKVEPRAKGKMNEKVKGQNYRLKV
jgi:hypothetical protein